MKLPIKKIGIFLILQLLIFVISLLCDNNTILLNYIDISFYFASILLLSALLIYIIQTGFFDVVTIGLRKVFSRDDEKVKISDITPLSRLVAISQRTLFLYGLLLLICMLIALLVYYV